MKNAILFVMTFVAFWLWIYGYSVSSAAVNANVEFQIHATNVWMLCDATAKALFALSLAIFFDSYLREWFIFLSCLSINNVLDELYFDPLRLGWNEAAIFIIVLVYYTFRITKAIYGAAK